MIATIGLFMAGSALAADMPAAGKAKCGTCHAIDKKIIGPSYMDISRKYKGDSDATGKIATSITKGGSFGWKLGTMPPRGMGAKDDEVNAMAKYIAGLAR